MIWIIPVLLIFIPGTVKGSILVLGGTGTASSYLSSVELITGNGTNCLFPNLTQGRYGAVAENLNGIIYVCGGFTEEDPFNSRTCEEFGFHNNTWSKSIPMSVGRGFPSSAFVLSTMVVLGGENSGGQISSTEYLDREAGYWMEGVTMSSNVEAACSVAISESSLVIVGGTSGSFLSKVELFDIETYEWTRLSDLRRGRYDHGCLLADVNGTLGVIVTGGQVSSGATSTVEFLNLKTWEWSDLPSLNSPRSGHEMGLLGGYPTVLGGYFSGVTEQFINGSWIQTPENNLRVERAWFSKVAVGNLSCDDVLH
ncbi:hypothetical protein TCAL_09781 [Tigriopus californicus]|uniref:Uncharacterized protein n=1 Tax=Tigriopus californicus TaxID=6832 RepID=A0A553PKB3_TIGCA|nr:influenza virus NS1A-binding protein-like [Tigriopus californicus]TRY78121.1 hypothetical protein TCAL_09781 [Tigriopus californicus]|eukprot:TCALIF_09781-PA protein Name:"Similar to KLHL12 Kelch-like protein 12 (Homo sapiens)" AED:0.00 eAED:0.00 QI:71/1/1/1/0.75/0.6/5/2607/310